MRQLNAQRETALLAEWLAQLPAWWQSKTHVRVGAAPLFYRPEPLDDRLARLAQNWADWADARIWTGAEVWVVEAKLIGTAGAYGQIIDYVNEYPQSEDAKQFVGAPVVGVVLCQASKPRTAQLFAGFGVRTIVYAPSFSFAQSIQKISSTLQNP